MDIINKKTGEVYEASIPYRTILDASEYQDCESYEKDSSLVDLTGFEPLASIVARCMRTMKSPSGAVSQVLDVSALRAEAQETGIYEAASASSLDEAFDTLDPTDAPGFDFVDGSQILEAVNDNIKAKKAKLSTTQSAPQGSVKAQEAAADAVGNSANEADMFEEKADLKESA